jgi:hypothetical protein
MEGEVKIVDRRSERRSTVVICFGVRGSDFCQEYLSQYLPADAPVPIAHAKDL